MKRVENGDKPIAILLVEDDPADVCLFEEMLAKATTWKPITFLLHCMEADVLIQLKTWLMHFRQQTVSPLPTLPVITVLKILTKTAIRD